LGKYASRDVLLSTARVRVRVETIMLDLGRYLMTLSGAVLGIEDEKVDEQFDLPVLDMIE
jgi:hypothetical protein